MRKARVKELIVNHLLQFLNLKTKTTETDGFNYPKRNYQYYNEPRIVVDYTSELYSVRESGTKQELY